MQPVENTAPDTPAYDPFMREIIDGDPYPIYRRLRTQTPRLFIEKYNAWFFSTFADVFNLSKARELSVASGITPSQLLLDSPANEFMVSQMDPPIHSVYRGLLNDIFKPTAAKKMEDTIRSRARQLLAEIRRHGGGDMMKDFGSPLAAEVGCMLSGLPRSDVQLQMQWNSQFFHRKPDHRGDTEVGGKAFMEILDYVGKQMAAVRSGRQPAEGSLGALLEAQKSDPSITDDHILYMVFNMQIAAGDTVPKGIASAMHRLWSNPEQFTLLRSRPDLSLAAFLEAVRIDMPTQMQGRMVVAPLDLDGTHIEPGQRTMFMFAAANRDEKEFDAPDTYRIDRNNKRTLGFGNGIHRCLGVHVAQIEGTVALEEVLKGLPHFEVDIAASHHHKTEFLKGWSHLTVTL